MIHTGITLAERPDLAGEMGRLSREGWPRFLLNDRVANEHWHLLVGPFARFQRLLLGASGEVMGVGHTVPLRWDGTLADLPDGWDAALLRAVQGREAAQEPTHLVGLAVLVGAPFQRQGLSRTILGEMKALAAQHGLGGVIVPVRPTLKSRYPLTPMERYVQWRREDGAPFDPWLRTHWRLGATLLRVAPVSQVVRGSVAEWEGWAEMRFPESGPYIVPGALNPVQIDREQDVGRYEEPNVWVQHDLAPSTGESNATWIK